MVGKLDIPHTILLFVIIAAMIAIGLFLHATSILLMWLLTMAALFLFAMIAGHGMTGLYLCGWLVNEQNRLSLSRLQVFLWTVVVLSAWLASVIVNLKAGHIEKALDIAIPQEVWLAMGISVASFVGSPIILSSKTQRWALAAQRANKAAPRRKAEKWLFRNETPADAKLSDLITGEEEGNKELLDISRLQNLFFTLALVGAYAVSLGSVLQKAAAGISVGPISEFPPISVGAAALLGISHAGYLGSKAVDKPANQG
jgi:hypothetical protein